MELKKTIVDTNVKALLDTFVESIWYKGDNERCPSVVMGLFNSIWYHHILGLKSTPPFSSALHC